MVVVVATVPCAYEQQIVLAHPMKPHYHLGIFDSLNFIRVTICSQLITYTDIASLMLLCPLSRLTVQVNHRKLEGATDRYTSWK